MIYGLVIAIHVIACLILITIILLQAGRGGGLSETFGMDSTQTIFGTKASIFLTRATVVAASLYLVTCLLLGILTSRRGKSLIELQGAPRTVPSQIPYTIPVGEPKETDEAQEAAGEAEAVNVSPASESEENVDK